MKLFIDTLDLELIKKYSDLGILSGVTTNPTFSKRFDMYNDVDTIRKVRIALDDYFKEIHIEVLGNTVNEIVENAKKLYSETKDTRLVFKIPFSETALKATTILHKAGHKTNLHLIYSVNQALLAASIGSYYISPLFGRLEDSGTNAFEQIKIMQETFRLNNESAKIMVSSIRCPRHVIQAYQIGVDSITIPPKVLDLMFKHSLTEKGIVQFKKDIGEKNE